MPSKVKIKYSPSFHEWYCQQPACPSYLIIPRGQSVSGHIVQAKMWKCFPPVCLGYVTKMNWLRGRRALGTNCPPKGGEPWGLIINLCSPTRIQKIRLKYLYVTCNYVSLNLTMHHYSSPPFTVHHYISLHITTYHYTSLLPITTHHYPSLPITTNHYPSLSITTHHCPPLPITIHHYTSPPIITHHYPSLWMKSTAMAVMAVIVVRRRRCA